MFGIFFFIQWQKIYYVLYKTLRTPTEIKKKKTKHCEITV